MSYVVYVMCLGCGGWTRINVDDGKRIFQRADVCEHGCRPTNWNFHSVISERTFNHELADSKTRSHVKLMNRSANHKRR